MIIKELIKEKGFTLKKVAGMMTSKNGNPISDGSLNTAISNNPTVDTLKKIADVIGVSRAEFFLDELPQPIAPTPPEFVGETIINGKRYGLVELSDESSST